MQDGSASKGDQVLANTILQMQNSMAHYKFHHAISDGDFGQALNIMAVSVTCFEVKLIYSHELNTSSGHSHSQVLGRPNI